MFIHYFGFLCTQMPFLGFISSYCFCCWPDWAGLGLWDWMLEGVKQAWASSFTKGSRLSELHLQAGRGVCRLIKQVPGASGTASLYPSRRWLASAAPCPERTPSSANKLLKGIRLFLGLVFCLPHHQNGNVIVLKIFYFIFFKSLKRPYFLVSLWT